VAQEMPNHFAGASRDLLLDSVLPLTNNFVEGLFNTRNTLRKPTKKGLFFVFVFFFFFFVFLFVLFVFVCFCFMLLPAEIAAGVPADAQLDMLTPQRSLLVETLCRFGFFVSCLFCC
jgi:hypothetical protein